MTLDGAARRRSRFVTALGWFAAVVGGFSLPVRLLALLSVTLHPDEVAAVLPDGANALEVFAVENLALMTALYLLAAVLMLVVGVGLIRRRSWALPAGAAFLALGALRQGSSLVVLLSGSASALAGLGPEQARQATVTLGIVYLASLLWLAFLLWFFRRPAIRSEFTRPDSRGLCSG